MRIDELNSVLPGRVLAPGHDEWEAARRFHSGSGEPDLIVRAASVADVARAVKWAASESVPVAVRGGGHSAWGEVPGGLTIDLSAVKAVDVDGTLVRIGGGAVWGHVAEVLADHQLGISSGDTASVGVGGLTLGGGIGWMVRAWGLAADQLVGVELVTAAGDVVEVSADAHPELWWALRGGGGNFGVVTRFDFRAHPLPGVVFAVFGLPADTRPALRAVRDLLRDAPRDVTVTFMDVPAMDPSAPAGATVSAVWIGDDPDAAREVLSPLAEVAGVTELELGVRRYPDILLDMPAEDPDAPGPEFIARNALLTELDDSAIDLMVSFREANAASVIFLRSLGGAFGDVTQADSAFPARDATWFAMAAGFDIPGLLDDESRRAVTAAVDAVEALGAGVYGNFTESVDPSFAAKIYPPATMARLRAVKREWDPDNVFSRNHNVLPA